MAGEALGRLVVQAAMQSPMPGMMPMRALRALRALQALQALQTVHPTPTVSSPTAFQERWVLSWAGQSSGY